MTTPPATPSPPEHLDVLIVGAGLSGIGAAVHLRRRLPGKRVAIAEARADLGGTWDLFRYPGIRSDSDLHTFGYRFKPWRQEQAIADGPSIKAYLREAAEEHGVAGQIRYGLRVVAAAWSTAAARWTVSLERVASGERLELTAGWLFGATGYYRYDEGYTPRFAGRERFRGTIVHPQHWPEGLDVAGRRVVVIGSGATAVTLVPALAATAARVTMLQRSPGYVMPGASRDAQNRRLRSLLGEPRAHALTRRKNVAVQNLVFRLSKRRPALVRRIIRAVNARQLAGSGLDVDVHFKPAYDPWTQRLCAVPDADLFAALRSGAATVVTDRIETFTETGIRLRSGQELAADVIVTATGLNLLPFGGIALRVDGEPVVLGETVAYKGLMLSGVPNFVFAVGYTNASWTLKVDLVCDYFCRLLAYAGERGLDAAVAELPEGEMALQPLLDFEAGYVLRSLDQLPRQGDRPPWHLAMDYRKDMRHLRHGELNDGPMRFFRAGATKGLPAAA